MDKSSIVLLQVNKTARDRASKARLFTSLHGSAHSAQAHNMGGWANHHTAQATNTTLNVWKQAQWHLGKF